MTGPERDWSIKPALVCLTCIPGTRPSGQYEACVIPPDEPIARNHRGHVIIATTVFVWLASE
jgi:hypothetical protein